VEIGIIGAGRIGGNIARQATRLGATVSSPRHAVQASEIVVISVPWSLIGEAVAQAGDLTGKVVIDTTNQFGSGPMPAGGETAATFNQRRMPGARYTKSFNTLTSAFQAETAGRSGADRVVQWLCGDDDHAKATVGELIEQMGYAAVDLGGTATCAVMEAPRRAGAVYGEEYRLPEALLVVEAVRAGRQIPPTPSY
jgi:predicted dinucleotide-binding enzyme